MGERQIYDIGGEIWNRKYKYHGSTEIPADITPDDSFRRVAKAAASKEENKSYWEAKFYEAMKDYKFLPGGRIIANAGTSRSEVTMFNCFVMNKIPDSIEGIFETVKESALTQKQGGGVGFDFSTIRPKGNSIKGCEAAASVRSAQLHAGSRLHLPHHHECRSAPRSSDGYHALRPSRYRRIHHSKTGKRTASDVQPLRCDFR